jgi:hypothetical protein
MAGCPFGLGIADFNRPGVRRVSEAYRLKQKHIDAHYIGEALANYLKFPTTFDGSLPSEAINGSPPRIKIGETYCFGDLANGGVIGTVTSATVCEEASEVRIGITDQNGHGQIWREAMSAEQLADYRAHKDSYFGKIVPVGKKIDDPFELFEWLVTNHKWLSRDQLLERLAHTPNIAELRTLSDNDLLYEYCELLVGSMWRPPASRPQPPNNAELPTAPPAQVARGGTRPPLTKSSKNSETGSTPETSR